MAVEGEGLCDEGGAVIAAGEQGTRSQRISAALLPGLHRLWIHCLTGRPAGPCLW